MNDQVCLSSDLACEQALEGPLQGPLVAVVTNDASHAQVTAILADKSYVAVVDELPSDGSDRLGVVVIGDRDGVAADVVLPADFSPRELITACRLLAQVVRLRRRLAEDTQQHDVWRQEASRDPLTQLPNRRAWDEELARRMDAAHSTNQPLCVALFDLDHFKQVNDGWGHAAGDQLLSAAATALRQSLRQEDFVARLGGDEFALLLSGLDAAGAEGVIERIRAGLPARVAQTTPFVTSASVGYFVWQPDEEATPDSLLAEADRARRLAKTRGRDRAVSVPS